MEEAHEEGFTFRCLGENEINEYLKAIHDLEVKGFPPDEAATEKSMLYRLSNAREYFYVLEKRIQSEKPSVIGYVCSTLAEGPSLTHESMYEHIPSASLLCIHSVAVDPDRRRKGIATAMLKHYVKKMHTQHSIKEFALICKKYLIPLYEKAGFQYMGESAVVHGQEQWYEMRISFTE